MIGKTLQDESLSASQLTAKEIVEIFSYNTDETNTFPYLHRYMNLVSKKINKIEKDKEKLKRFALAGLFLTYRACNHSGQLMETENLTNFDSGIHKVRLTTFRDYFNTEIKGTDHYLKMIDFSVLDFILLFFRLKSPQRKLYKFVVK